VMNLHGFLAPDDYETTLIEVANKWNITVWSQNCGSQFCFYSFEMDQRMIPLNNLRFGSSNSWTLRKVD
jgi:hypothetical protein